MHATNLPHVHTRVILLGPIQQLRCTVPPAGVKYHTHIRVILKTIYTHKGYTKTIYT